MGMGVPTWYGDAMTAAVEISRRRVFFVVGCQKSGTTWVERLLDAHPSVCCRGEGHFSDLLGPVLEQAIRLHNDEARVTWTVSQQEAFAAVRLLTDGIFARYLANRPEPGAVRIIGDRTPEAATGIPALDALYPGASFVHVIRDGRDGAVSGWAHLERENGTGRFATFADYAGYFARNHWAPYIRRARRAGERLGKRYTEVRYERLLADPRGEAARLLEFLGVAADGATAQACVDRASFQSLSGGREPGQEDRTSHYRKGIAGEWRDRFDEEALRRFESEAGDLLAELGYAGENKPGLIPAAGIKPG